MISINKCKDTDRRCHVCLAANKSELDEIDIAMGVKSVKECYELLIGSRNCHTQIILCKNCLKELNMLSSEILEKDKEESKERRKIVNGSLLETYNICKKE